MALTPDEQKYIKTLPKAWDDKRVLESLKKYRVARSGSTVTTAKETANRALAGFENTVAGLEAPQKAAFDKLGKLGGSPQADALSQIGRESIIDVERMEQGREFEDMYPKQETAVDKIKQVGSNTMDLVATAGSKASTLPVDLGIAAGKIALPKFMGIEEAFTKPLQGLKEAAEIDEGEDMYSKAGDIIGTGAKTVAKTMIPAGAAFKAGKGLIGAAAPVAGKIETGLRTLGRGAAGSIASTGAANLALEGELPSVGDIGLGLAIDGAFGGLGAGMKAIGNWAKNSEAAKAIAQTGDDIAEIPSGVKKGAIKVGKNDLTTTNLAKSGIMERDIAQLDEIRKEAGEEMYNYTKNAYKQAQASAKSSYTNPVNPARDNVAEEIKDIYTKVKNSGKQTAAAIKAEAKTLKEQPKIIVSGIKNDVASTFDDLGIKIGKSGQLNFSGSRLNGRAFSNEQALLNDIWQYVSPQKGQGGSLRTPDGLLIKIQNVFDTAKKDELYSTVYTPIKTFRDSAKTALEEMADSNYKQLAIKAAKTMELLDDLEGWFGKGAESASNVLPRIQSRAVSSKPLNEFLKSLNKTAGELGVPVKDLAEKANISVMVDRLAGVREPEGFTSQIERAINGAAQTADFALAPVKTGVGILKDKLSAIPKQKEAIEAFFAARDNPELRDLVLKPLADNIDQAITKNPELIKIPGFRIALKGFLLGGDEEED